MIESQLPKLKTAFYGSHFRHCVVVESKRIKNFFSFFWRISFWNFPTFKVDDTVVEKENNPSEYSSSEDENEEKICEDETKKSIKSKYYPPLRFKVAWF